jgi:hypothetical protein
MSGRTIDGYEVSTRLSQIADTPTRLSQIVDTFSRLPIRPSTPLSSLVRDRFGIPPCRSADRAARCGSV